MELGWVGGVGETEAAEAWRGHAIGGKHAARGTKAFGGVCRGHRGRGHCMSARTETFPVTHALQAQTLQANVRVQAGKRMAQAFRRVISQWTLGSFMH